MNISDKERAPSGSLARYVRTLAIRRGALNKAATRFRYGFATCRTICDRVVYQHLALRMKDPRRQ
jgi:hypothetical protein